jgi:hypothetical protein
MYAGALSLAIIEARYVVDDVRYYTRKFSKAGILGNSPPVLK